MKIILPFYARLALVLLSIVLIIYLLYIGQGILIPLFFAVFISLYLYPLCTFFERRFHIGRGVSAFLAVLCFVIVLAAFLYFLTFQMLAFAQDIPTLQLNINSWLLDVQQWISKEYQIDSSIQVQYMNQALNSIAASVTASLGAIFLRISGLVFWVIIIFIYTYFILHHRRLIFNFIIRLFPSVYQEKVHHVVSETRYITKFYLQGLLIEFVVVAIANCTAFLILGIKYAVLLGLIAALLNFIPYLGFIVSALLIFLVTMANSGGFIAIQATGILFILHVIDANVLLPLVVGNKVKINALITIVAVLIGGAIWGVAGMFLSIPLTAILKIIFEYVDELRPWAYLMGSDDNKQ